MAGIIPVGWRAAVLMVLLIVLFPLLICVLVLDALTHDMPLVRTPVKHVMQWLSGWLHHRPRRGRELPHPAAPAVRHAH
jgi:hypothetical protein